MSIVATLEVNVTRGAALLDEQIPDWFLRIEPAQVDIRNPCRCVLGHLFGHYYDGLGHLFGHYYDGLMGLDIQGRSSEYGFTVLLGAKGTHAWSMQFDVLNALWRDTIASRRCAWLVMQAEAEKEVLTA